ncbi:MFS transporter [Escherichia coli]|uniref:MFS transporter n=1 Tax=Escherichia coli TaxID=562 RepID=UPI0018A61BB0|nr:MFS transporter [Escherichia coli]MBL3141546.1 MFS transporter [Klebsiella pneumoniae]BBW53717.1 hypothetical protein THOESC003_P10410 [Escherichia coli]HDW3243002.1 MFS transporter [Escherichia coli]
MYALLFSIFLMAFSANIPVSLFNFYEQLYQLSKFDLTFVFAVYGVSLLIALQLSGHLYRTFGYRAGVVLGLLLALCAGMFFTFGSSYLSLIIARVLNGASLGVFMGGANTLLLLTGSRNRKIINLSGILTLFGFGFGPLFSGLCYEYLGVELITLPFIVLMLAAVFIFIFLIPTLRQSKDLRSAAGSSLAATAASPGNNRLFFAFVLPSIFLMFTLNSSIMALLPSVAVSVLHISNHALPGALLFILLSGGLLAKFLFPNAHDAWRVRTGIISILAGGWLMLLGSQLESLTVFVIAILFQAAGCGFIFPGTLSLAAACAEGGDVSLNVSRFYLSAYSGMVIPTLLIGVLSGYTGIILALAILLAALTILACWLWRNAANPEPADR